MKKETEGMMMAAQDQALGTNYVKKKMDKQDVIRDLIDLGIRSLKEKKPDSRLSD